MEYEEIMSGLDKAVKDAMQSELEIACVIEHLPIPERNTLIHIQSRFQNLINDLDEFTVVLHNK